MFKTIVSTGFIAGLVLGLTSLSGCSSPAVDPSLEQQRQAQQIKQTEQGARDAQKRLDNQ